MTEDNNNPNKKTLEARVLEIVSQTNGTKGNKCEKCGRPTTVSIDSMLGAYAEHYDGSAAEQYDFPIWECVPCREKTRKLAEAQKTKKTKTVQRIRETGLTDIKKKMVYHFLTFAKTDVAKWGNDKIDEKAMYDALLESLAEIWEIDPKTVRDEVYEYLQTKLNVSL